MESSLYPKQHQRTAPTTHKTKMITSKNSKLCETIYAHIQTWHLKEMDTISLYHESYDTSAPFTWKTKTMIYLAIFSSAFLHAYFSLNMTETFLSALNYNTTQHLQCLK